MSWLEEERRSGRSYFSWLVRDLTVTVLPPYLLMVDSSRWHTPMSILEQREESIFRVGDSEGLQITHFNQLFPVGKGVDSQDRPCYLPNGSRITQHGNLITTRGVKSLWKDILPLPLVRVNAQNEIYVLDRTHQTVTVFDEEGQLLKTASYPLSAWTKCQLVGQELFILDSTFRRWNIWTNHEIELPIDQMSSSFRLAIEDSTWLATMVSDHYQYIVVCDPTDVFIYSLDLKLVNTIPLVKPKTSQNSSTVYYGNRRCSPNGVLLSPSNYHELDKPIPAISSDGLIHIYYPCRGLHSIIGPTASQI